MYTALRVASHVDYRLVSLCLSVCLSVGLHLFWRSTSDISWSWFSQRTFWKCRISKHRCFY